MSTLYISESILHTKNWLYCKCYVLIPTYKQWDHVVNTYVRGLRKQNVGRISSTASIYNVIICACPSTRLSLSSCCTDSQISTKLKFSPTGTTLFTTFSHTDTDYSSQEKPVMLKENH